MFDKEHIMAEIRRTAVDGVAFGMGRFEQETGIKPSDWRGRYWARWSDAAAEVELATNDMQGRIDDKVIIEHLAVSRGASDTTRLIQSFGCEHEKATASQERTPLVGGAPRTS